MDLYGQQSTREAYSRLCEIISIDEIMDEVVKSLSRIFCGGDGTKRSWFFEPRPVANDTLINRFIEHLHGDFCIAYHATKRENSNSIANRGLLIPDAENGVKVSHGSALGRGIYLAKNMTTACGYLSSTRVTPRFEPNVFVCLINNKGLVYDSDDVVVVERPDHVLPIIAIDLCMYPRQRKGSVCRGVTKKGDPCQNGAKYGHYCGIHKVGELRSPIPPLYV
jgi:hypothetical protein